MKSIPKLRLIKGRGAAHLREKCVAAAAKHFVVVVDEQKVVKKLGTAAVPVEVLPFAIMPVMDELRGLGCDPGHPRGGQKGRPGHHGQREFYR